MSEWTEWTAAEDHEGPVPNNTRVEVKLRGNGGRHYQQTAELVHWGRSPDNPDTEVVAYRIVA